MRRLLASRWVRRVVVLLVGLGAVATATTDFAVASDRRAHDRKVAAARKVHGAESRYLDSVSEIAHDVYDVVQPYHQVLDAVIADPTAIYSARDGFASAEPAQQMRALSAKFDALVPPPTMRSHHADLARALRAYVADLGAIRGKASVLNPDRLYEAITDVFTSELDADDVGWQAALQTAFAVHAARPPRAPSADQDAPPSVVTWTFRADRSCASSLRHADPAIHRIETSAGTAGDLALVGHTLLEATASLRRLALPVDEGPRLRDQIVNRLGVADTAGRALVAVSSGVKKRSRGSVLDALRRLTAAGHEVRPLVRGFASRHAIACENLFGVFLIGPSSSTSHPTVNA